MAHQSTLQRFLEGPPAIPSDEEEGSSADEATNEEGGSSADLLIGQIVGLEFGLAKFKEIRENNKKLKKKHKEAIKAAHHWKDKALQAMAQVRELQHMHEKLGKYIWLLYTSDAADE